MKTATLRTLLERGGDLTLEGFPKALEGASGAAVGDRIAKSKREAAWKRIVEQLGDKDALRLLDVDLMTVLCGAWSKYRVLAEYLDPAKHPASEMNVVALADHTLSMKYRPTLDVTVDGVGCGRLEFELTVRLAIKTLTLTIQNGRIVELGSGSCQGNVRLALDGAELLDRDFPAVTLPAVLDLRDGVSIGERTASREPGAGEVTEKAAVGTDGH